MEFSNRCEACGNHNYCCRVVETHHGCIIYFNDIQETVRPRCGRDDD